MTLRAEAARVAPPDPGRAADRRWCSARSTPASPPPPRPRRSACVGALALSAAQGSLTWQGVRRLACMGATRLYCMIALILAGAVVPDAVDGLHRPAAPPGRVHRRRSACRRSRCSLALMVFFIVLGCFLDGISMVVLTMGVILPTVQSAGIDLLWFGIFIVLVVEMAQITPPVGFNLFVLQGMTEQRDHAGSRA
ncbi:MAG: TRAP transporter large permease subunit [Comamonadaceae bacterium]|nr:TRAP transporter large permease subunit [Comamonadaceae bacterium]